MPAVFTVILACVLKQLFELHGLLMIPYLVHEILWGLALGYIHPFTPIHFIRGISFHKGARVIVTIHIDVAGLYSCFTWNDAVPYLWVILERPECL